MSISTASLTAPSGPGPLRNRNALGEYAREFSDFDAPSLATTLVASEVLHSEVIDSSPLNQEAAAAYKTVYPWATAEDFEDALFDTWDTEAEFDAYLRSDENRLGNTVHQVAYLQRAGGIAVFTEPGAMVW